MSGEVPVQADGGVAELPTGTLTMLFSDIEGSTALVRRLGSGTARRCRRSGRCCGPRSAVSAAGS